ncbi:MAG: alpha-L-glutamate ligase [Chloroflexi bacterium]|nr:MAG: alpha-L-glutamate ligase [Chloroflexota bacterium]
MNRNIQALLDACKRLNIPHQIHHKTNNLISVVLNNQRYTFVNWTTPFNTHSVMKLCQDKDYFYSFYHDIIRMPKTHSFLNPYSDSKYTHYLDSHTIYGIIEQIEAEFTYPLIVKKNRGSWGTNVFKVENRRELEQGLLEIYSASSARSDYIGLAQEYIDVDVEYRAIFFLGKYQFAYKKIAGDTELTDNLSPLHSAGSKAEYVTDEGTKQAICHFCAPLFDKLMIQFCGLDIAQDKAGHLWLIEANSSPGFDHIIRHEGDELIIQLYEKMLKQLAQ